MQRVKTVNKAVVMRAVGTALMWLVGIILLVCSVFPFLWVVISSFKPLAEIQSITFHFFPKQWTAENYANLFAGNSVYFPRGVSFVRSLGMTFLVSVIALVLSLAVNSLAAYAFARLEFPGKKLLWAMYVVNMFVPSIACTRRGAAQSVPAREEVLNFGNEGCGRRGARPAQTQGGRFCPRGRGFCANACFF